MDQLKRALGDDITVFSGDDSLTLAFMASGAEGVISVASNLMPGEVTRMVRLPRQRLRSATKLHRRLYPLFKTLFIEPNPVPLKAALARAGIIGSEAVRLPLIPLPGSRAALVKALAGLAS